MQYGTFKQCKGAGRGYLSKILDEQNYYSTLTYWILKGPEEDWAACLDTLLDGFEPRYLDYLRREVVAHDYMPYPGSFVLPSWGPEIVEQVKRERRPMYVALVALVEVRLA